ncbi:MAG: ShlB/FhaC/HecB family hemolysin secretion/activation protein [Dechloromonas sp.]|nr:ShlB/FhaC/HecB family hemolysin secretion/activation protein [Dechloromonas sp.]
MINSIGHAQAADEHFQINAYEVSGNHLLNTQEITQLLTPFTGSNRVFGDIQKALEAIEGRYRQLGYAGIQVGLPEQALDSGKVRMTIIESSLSRIKLTGNTHFTNQNILASLPTLQVGAPVNIRVLSESIQLTNENPAKTVDLVLGVGNQPGELEARLEVQDEKPWRVYVTADNTGNASTGHDRVGVAVQHANLFDADHVATAAYTTSLERPDRTSIYSLSYRLPLYRWGDSLDFILGYSDVSAGSAHTVAGPLQFSGTGEVFGLRYNHILARQGHYSHRLIFAVDQRNYDNTCTLGGAAVCGAGGADISVRPLGVSYSGQWSPPGQATQFALGIFANLPGQAKGEQADFTAARLDATARYQLLKGSFAHSRNLPGHWQARIALSGQYTRDALVAGEQFSLAGSNAVRGFAERAVAVDHGLLATTELYTPELPLSFLSGSLRALAFADYGLGAFNKTPPGLHGSAHIASIGLGLRYTMAKQTSLRFDLARVVSGGPVGSAQAGDWSGHAGLTYGF